MDTKTEQDGLLASSANTVVGQLEDKIRGLVVHLNERGIATFASCEGHFRQPGRSPVPYVLIDIHKTDPHQLVWFIDRLSRFNMRNVGTYLEWTTHPMWSITYGVPHYGLHLRPLRDNPDNDRFLFEILQEGIAKLLSFLQSESKQ